MIAANLALARLACRGSRLECQRISLRRLQPRGFHTFFTATFYAALLRCVFNQNCRDHWLGGQMSIGDFVSLFVRTALGARWIRGEFAASFAVCIVCLAVNDGQAAANSA